jgi:hypothetical protein
LGGHIEWSAGSCPELARGAGSGGVGGDQVGGSSSGGVQRWRPDLQGYLEFKNTRDCTCYLRALAKGILYGADDDS